jgi:alkanesulfonate monooxygenase SsuD/methylene tetrahydromethanopterin reductase-like flavin-dependent oxidoreductase (luciferase family)
MTYLTCPIRRYHPVVVAQKAATTQLLSDGRFTLGLGAGENLNEHIVGGRWPIPAYRSGYRREGKTMSSAPNHEFGEPHG